METKSRDEILEELRRGRLTPAEAEAIAEQNGVGPLAHRPDPSKFDPMGEPVWTLAMAVAWIVWRTPDHVRENSDPYRSECMDCVPAGDCGWEIQQQGPASLTWLLILEATREEGDEQWSKLMSVKSAQEDLIRHLAESSLTAFAIEQASRSPVEIPHREWPYLALFPDRPWRDELRFKTDPLRPAYTHITLQSAEILKIWPAQSIDDEVKTAAPPTKPKRYPQADVDAALERHKRCMAARQGPCPYHPAVGKRNGA